MGSRIGWFFGKLVSVAAAIASAVLMTGIYMTKMFPQKYIIGIGAGLLVLLVLITVFTWNSKGKLRYFVGFILGLLLCAAAFIGSKYVFKTIDTAKQITTVSKTELSQVGVYVKEENNDDLDDVVVGYQFGIVKAIDRENTDKALELLRAEYAPQKAVKEFESLPQMVKALKDEEVDAVLMNTAFLDVLEEMDDFENIKSEIKLVKTYDVESEIKEEEKSEASTAINSEYEGHSFCMYISGIDTRSSRLEAKSRSDVNILAVVNPDTNQVLLVSTPRDYFVPLSISGGANDKLTHAGIYGIQVSKDTVGMIYDLDIDYYFRVNFTGFENIINALGGIDVYSEYDFTSDDGYHYNKGINSLDGAAALSFARERHAFTSGDNQRGKNQMAVIKAVIDKMTSVKMLRNYNEVLSAMEGSFETTLPYDKISELVKGQLESGKAWNVVSYSVTGSGSSAVPYSMSQRAYVMIPNEESIATAKTMIKQVYDDRPVSEQEAGTETETDGALTYESVTESSSESEAN